MRADVQADKRAAAAAAEQAASLSRTAVYPPESSSIAQLLLRDLLRSGLIPDKEWNALPATIRDELGRERDGHRLLQRLVQHQLLTEYQSARVAAGKIFGLVLGNYRVLERLGAGGMGVVFRAEHLRMRRQVAVKVLPLDRDEDPRLLQRFSSEMEALGQVQHPNIVNILDAGETPSPDPSGPVLHYLVMEYVPGQDLEAQVQGNGPLGIAQACDIAYQLASALGEAHRHHLVHRDVKPSNVLLTPEGQAKLLDFGLVRQPFRNRLTEPGTTLGTIDFMAPEQAQDASRVDIRADIYGLGGTLYWCLTGQLPFPPQGSLLQTLTCRLTQPPPSLRSQRPEVPADLDAVVARMMALRADDRYPDPQAVLRALGAFLKPGSRERLLPRPAVPLPEPEGPAAPGGAVTPRRHRILIVDDEADIRGLLQFGLQGDGLDCREAADGIRALEAVRAEEFDLVLLDIDMPGMKGTEVLRRLREDPPGANLKVVMVSGRASADEMAQMLAAGADDYLTKPFSVVQFRARIQAALRLKEAQDRADGLTAHLAGLSAELERDLGARDSELVQARNALVLALAKLVEHRQSETSAHVLRLQRYCRTLAEEAAGLPAFAGQIDEPFIRLLESCVPLHDIGTVGLPDHILLKPGRLDPDERILMQTHTSVGADTLVNVAREHGAAAAFLQTAAEIARHHHERWDGSGYPTGLAGTAIPLAARIVAVGDVYDALRSRRPYKPPLPHAAAIQVMKGIARGHFDPSLTEAFDRCATRFERIFRELPD